MSLAAFAGISLFAVYHTDGDIDLPPQWVAHFANDPVTGRPMGDADTVIDDETIKDLVRRGAILHPYTADR